MNQYENRLNAYAKAKEYSLDKKDDNDNKSEGLIKTTVSNPIKEITAKNGLTPIALSQSKDGKESLYRRVAKFLLIIGVEEAAKIIPHLTQEQIDLIVPEIASIRSVDPDEATVILAEFENEVTAEIELNLGLPASMPGIYFVTAFCSEGITTNQPLTGYFNPSGVLLADQGSCKTFLVDRDICEDEIAQARCRALADGLPPVPQTIIDLIKEYFQ